MSRTISQKYKNMLLKKTAAWEYLKTYVVPINGIVSYGFLGAHLMAPELVGLGMSRRNASSILLTSTLLTTSVFLFDRPQFAMLPRPVRGVFAFYGASVYSLGSMLCWGLLKTTLPLNENWLSIGLGFFTGAALTKISYDFMKYCDDFYLPIDDDNNEKKMDKDKDAEDEKENEKQDKKEGLKELSQSQCQEVYVEIKPGEILYY